MKHFKSMRVRRDVIYYEKSSGFPSFNKLFSSIEEKAINVNLIILIKVLTKHIPLKMIGDE